MAQAAADLRAGQDQSATARAAWGLSALTQDELGAALRWAADLPAEDAVKDHLAGVILGLWANHDLDAAWSAYREFPNPKERFSEPLSECGHHLFLKRWHRGPAACIAGLKSGNSAEETGARRAAQTIHASRTDRERWMQEVASTASDEARCAGAWSTILWAGEAASERAEVFPWLVALPFHDPGQRILAMGSLMGEVADDAEMEPAFSSWIGSLEGEAATSTRQWLLEAALRAPEAERLKLSRKLEDPILRRAIQESL